ncbi:MAG: 6-hydroxycyclohex-1-ene-1-carbonyl-CoA dehydrogenase [Gemmatimonadota bacterium]|nr:6-hydroxycyclohex-1-ene-1-carbonyl-CoA dehydrogenase [Gemmatimonadota bacterium]
MSGTVEGSAYGWFMTAVGAPLERRVLSATPPGPGEARIAVAGCGVCHTDLSFLVQGVKTRHGPPLVLGHEISGVVREVGAGCSPELIGRPVIVPAVLPCGECELCRADRRTICRQQVMPGNDRDGGFASHVVVPARFLCPVPPEVLDRHELWELAVVSDAVATPFQAVRRSDLARGELTLFVGVGGIGLYGVQIAAAVGAVVIALDVDDAKLRQAEAAGARATLNVAGLAAKEVRRQVRELVASVGASAHLWKIFETSGTPAGQETAYGLLGFGASLSVVGYTPERLDLCLSNLMAFDAAVRGNWGADPLLYEEVLRWLAEGRIQVRPYVERRPLSRINEVIADAHRGTLQRRVVLVPD